METVSDIQDFQDDVAASWERLVDPQPSAQPATPAAKADAPSTSLAVFDPIQSGLSELRQRYSNVAFDLRTVKGNDEARQARKALVSLRSRTDDAYSNWNAPILEQQKAARALRDSIKAEIQKIEAPIDEQIKADEARREAERRAKEEAEAARLAGIRARLVDFGSAAASVALGDAAQIRAQLDWLCSQDPVNSPESFQEFLEDAKVLHAKAFVDLERLLEDRLARDAEAARLERERRELEQRRQEETARIAAERAELDRKLAEERAQMAAERAELERQREEARLEREQMRLERERREEELRAVARAEQAARQAAEAQPVSAPADLIGDSAEPQVESAPPAIVIVAAPPAPPAPPAPRQEDAFSAELETAVAEAAPDADRDRPTDRELTLAIAERFNVKQSTAAIWLSHFDAIVEIDRCITEGA